MTDRFVVIIVHLDSGDPERVPGEFNDIGHAHQAADELRDTVDEVQTFVVGLLERSR